MSAWMWAIVWAALAGSPPSATHGAASLLSSPESLQSADLAWVPPPTAGIRLPALAPTPTDRALLRKPWCSFGHHAQRFATGGPSADVVFRRPSQVARAALNEIRENITNPDNYKSRPAAEARFNELVRTVDGPALVRITLQDTDARIQLMALKATTAIVALQPRLAAFATGYLGVKDPQLAGAAVELHFASDCDTAVIYALDGFRHPDEGVQLTTLRLVLKASQDHENLRLADRIAALVAQGVGTPRARVVALRILGQLGTLATANQVEGLLKDKDDRVAAEALATLAVLQPESAAKLLTKWLKDKSPLKRAGALRAFAQVHGTRRDLAENVIRPLTRETTPLPDTLGVGVGPGKTIGEVARAALAYMEME